VPHSVHRQLAEQAQQLARSKEKAETTAEAVSVQQQQHEEDGVEWGEQLQHPKRRLLQAGSSRRRLPGEYGGGEASDVVCDSTTLSYTAQIGPLGPQACGQYNVGERSL
jgi:hypothetical protein